MAWRQLQPRQRRPGARAGVMGLIDIGSSKLCSYIARPKPGHGFVLAGRGYQIAEGMRAGEIIDAEAAEASILAVINEAEQAAGEQLREIAVTWSGGRPRAQILRIERNLNGRTIGDEDLQWGLELARQQAQTRERAILHILPVEMRVDGGRALRDPRGLSGQTLEMIVSVVTVAVAPLRNLIACLNRCHLDVAEITTSAYAAGIGTLTADEVERGCLLLDMGGGTTNIAHFHGGRLVYVDQVGYGGDHVTRDLAYGLSTSHALAERIKNLYGGVQWRACDDNMRISVPLIGDHIEMPTGEVPRTRLTQIIRARVEETLAMVQDRLKENWDLFEKRPPRSVVFTGGACQIEGMEELAEEMFGLPSRVGRPAIVHGGNGVEDQPCCSAASGGLALVAGNDGGLSWKQSAETPVLTHGLTRITTWLRQNFVS